MTGVVFSMNLRSRCGDRRLPARVRRAVRLLGAVLVLLPAWVAEAQTLVRAPYLQSGTSSSVIIKWRTDEATDSVVRYGLDPDSLTLSASDPDSTTEHAVQLTGLSADVKYYYSVGSSSVLQMAGGDRDHFVVTAPVPGTAKPTRIWVIGDSGTADRNAEAVRDAFLEFTGSRNPDLWIMLGDNAYSEGNDVEYQAAVFDTYPQVLPRTVLWPTLGNHDGRNADSTTESGPYYDIFSLPRNGEAGGVASGTEAYYSFDYGNMHFICLDSDETDRSADGAMMTWLAADLAANDKEWVIAFWHHSPYTKSHHDSDREGQAISMRENAGPLLERYGVDLVLTGHSHSYERSYLIDSHYGYSGTFTDAMKKNPGDGSATGDGAYQKPAAVGAPHAGAVYVVAGTAGVVKPGGSLDHPAMAVSFRTLGSMVLDVDGSRLDAIFLDSTGNIRDDFTILKIPEMSGSVAENTAAGEGIVAVADENPEADRTYSLAGRDGNSDHTPFTIDRDEGHLRTDAPLDYEQPTDADGNNIYEVVVLVADGEAGAGNEAGTDDSVLVTIHVTDVDEAGTVRLSPDEPQALTPLTATLADEDRDSGHAVIWEWHRSSNGTSDWGAPIATSASYTPQADDADNYLRATASYTDRLSLSPLDRRAREVSAQVKAAPKVVLELLNVQDGTLLGNNTIPEDGGQAAVRARLTGGTSGLDTVVTLTPLAQVFTLDGTTLTIPAGQTESTPVILTTVGNAVDEGDDLQDHWTVQVTGTQRPVNPQVTGTPTATLTLIDDENPPTVTLTLSPETISENSGETTVTARLSHPSSEPTMVRVSSKPGDGATEDDFTQLREMVTIDAGRTEKSEPVVIMAENNEEDEADKTVEVSGQVTTQNTAADPPMVELTITDDDPPQITTDTPLPPYVEGDDKPVATYTATNPDPDTVITWLELEGDDKALFDFAAGVLRFKTPPNFEDEPPPDANGDNIYEVTVRASDGTLTSEAFFVRVEVRDAPGALCLSASASSCRPLTAPQVGQEVHAILEDPDGIKADEPVTWVWERVSDKEAPDADWTRLNNPTASYTPDDEDVDHYLRVTVTYTDGDGTEKEAQVTAAEVTAAPDDSPRPPPSPPGPSGPPGGGPPSGGPPAEERPAPVGYLENPGAGSFQSGIGLISGWVCDADEVEIAIGDSGRQGAAYGTERLDTLDTCGDTDNGFGLLFNWNHLGDGAHTVVAYVDEVELGRATVTVTTVGEGTEEEFLRGVEGECMVEDFPSPGETVRLEWQQNNQNFVITSGTRPAGANRAGIAGMGYLENPGADSFQSGIGLISGWVCAAEAVEIAIGAAGRQGAAYGTERLDTLDTCGDTNNGFGLLFNWNRLGAGEHTVVALVDGAELGRAVVRVTTVGEEAEEEFLRGVEGECVVEDFPRLGQSVLLAWQQNSQNFVITDVE